MALTIEQIQTNITNKADQREIINQLADYIQANPGGGGGSSYLVKAVVTLTDAQIKLLPSTPINIVAAPGANKVIVFQQVIGMCDFRAGVYSNVGDVVRFYVRSGSAFHSCQSVNSNWIMEDDTELNYFWLTPELFKEEGVDDLMLGTSDVLDGGINQPLTLFCAKFPDTTSFEGGHADNTIKLIIYYTIEDTPIL